LRQVVGLGDEGGYVARVARQGPIDRGEVIAIHLGI
jgi:hypothetical protein